MMLSLRHTLVRLAIICGIVGVSLLSLNRLFDSWLYRKQYLYEII